MTPIRSSFLFVFATPLVYSAARIWRRMIGGDPADESRGFRRRIGFTQLDGMESLSLELANASKDAVWAEEIEIFLSDLRAEEQTSEASCHEIQKIRQVVGGGDMVPISLAGSIYKAAGAPQRKYSCVLSPVLRYRIGEEWFENKMEHYKIGMIGLRGSSIQRESRRFQRLQIQNESQNAAAMALKLK
jgi:hypothetical protein